MILFLLKKNFCDGWDNFLFLLIPNLIISLFCGFAFLILSRFLGLENAFAVPLMLLAFIGLLAAGMVFALAFSENAANIADYRAPTLAGYFKQIPKVLADGLRYGALLGFILVAGFIGIPSYFSAGGIVGNALALALLFFEVILILSLQWFIPLRALLGGSFVKTLKKCFVIFFDNTGFSVFMFFYNFFLGASSFLLLTIAPGATGIVLSLTNALRLRLYKYDWLDAHPENKGAKLRKKIPWRELIKEDEETVGPRGFKSFFMPWKND